MPTLTSNFVRISPRDSRYFELSGGASYVPVGLNLCFPRFVSSADDGLSLYRQWITALAANGGNFMRLWLSHDFFDIEHSESGVYDDSRLKRLQCVLAMARASGIRVKITLEHFRFIEPAAGPVAESFPGAASFARTMHHQSRGGQLTSTEEFFQSPAARAQFCRKLDFLAQHFATDDTIFGWELWNEINTVRSSSWQEWSAAMLVELRRRFPNHLTMQSVGSFDDPGSYDCYQRIWTLPHNDIVQVHRYVDPGATLEVCHGPMDIIAADGVTRASASAPTKPVTLAEAGAVLAHHAGPSDLYAKDTDGILLHDLLFAPFFAGAAGPGQAWHWDFYVAKNNLWHHYGRFARAIAGIDFPAEQFKPIRLDAGPLRVYGLEGHSTLLLWCRDGRANWHSELAQHLPAPAARDVILPLPAHSAAACSAEIYDPWSDTAVTLAVNSGEVMLPEFRRSIVLRLCLKIQ